LHLYKDLYFSSQSLLSSEKLNMANMLSKNDVDSQSSSDAPEGTARRKMFPCVVRRASTSGVSNCDRLALSTDTRRHSACDISNTRQVTSSLEPIPEKSSSNRLCSDIDIASVSAKRLSVNSLTSLNDSEDYFPYLLVDVPPLQ